MVLKWLSLTAIVGIVAAKNVSVSGTIGTSVTTSATPVLSTASANPTVAGNNSVYVPTYGIHFNNVMNTRGNSAVPMDHDIFVQNTAQFWNTYSANSSDSKLTRRTASTGATVNNTVCIPLVDQTNAIANPYSPDLISVANSQARIGYGSPVVLQEYSLLCPTTNAGPCSMTVTVEATTTDSYTYGITTSDSQSITNTVGVTNTHSTGDSYSNSVANTIENSFTQGSSQTQDGSYSNTVSNSLNLGYDQGVTIGATNTQDGSSSIGTNTNSDNNWSNSDETSGTLGWEAGVSEFGFSASGSGSVTNGQTSSNGGSVSIGSNTENNNGWSESNNQDDTSSSSLSQGLENSGTINQGYSDTTDQSQTASNAQTNTYETSHSVEFSQSNESSSSKTGENTNGTSSDTGVQYANSTVVSYTFSVNPGDCQTVVCLPWVNIVTVPFVCVSNVTQQWQLRYADIMGLDKNLEKFDCVLTTVECQSIVSNNLESIPSNTNTVSATTSNSIKSGEYFQKFQTITSTNGEFTLTLQQSGNLVVTQNSGTIVWQSNTNYLTNYPTRARINEKGHFILESQNFFSKVNYRQGQWITMWSTTSINHNYTIGVPRQADVAADGYTLLLENTGLLNLYDAASVNTWCTPGTQNMLCNYQYGYFHPEDYLMPTDIVTANSSQGDYPDPHNTIPSYITFTNRTNIVSIDAACNSSLQQTNGLISPNQRFKVILDQTGNLVVKDGVRTMWSTYTANMNNTVAPYSLILTNFGELVIQDSTYRWLWQSLNTINNSSGPYTATILDKGDFVVTNSSGYVVWETWPINNISYAMNINSTIRNCYKPCNNCPAPPATTTTKTTTTTTTTKATTTTTTKATTTKTTSTPTPTTPPCNGTGTCKTDNDCPGNSCCDSNKQCNTNLNYCTSNGGTCPLPPCTGSVKGTGTGKGVNGNCCSTDSDCQAKCLAGVCGGFTGSSCSGGSPGKSLGNGGTGACCNTSNDCEDTCTNGTCGITP